MTAPEEQAVLAAELALGLLDGAERTAAEARVLADPVFAAEVDRWRATFAGMLAEVPAVEPPAHLAAKVEAIAAGTNDRGVSPAWRWATAAAVALATALALALATRPAPPAPPPPAPPTIVTPPPVALTPALVAALAGEDQAPFAAYVMPARDAVRVVGADKAPRGRSAQLWSIGSDGQPHPLGIMPNGGDGIVRLAAVDRRYLDAGATLAVSIEPEGGSPTGKPTGPVVATGKLRRT